MRGPDRMGGMPILQFSLRDLLLGMTIASIGLAMVYLAAHITPTNHGHRGIKGLLAGGGSVLIAQGVCTPIRERRWIVAAACAVAAFIVGMFVLG
jgi:hypothetical protein